MIAGVPASPSRYTRRMLLCPVRGCHLPLMREDRRLLCARAHSFDVARTGYINLLQPQDRRSKLPGDTKAAVAARRRLHDLGVTGPLLRGIAEILGAQAGDVVLDAGCGDGFYLGTLARELGFDAHGVDISTFAADAAARRFPPGERLEWIVANADRFVPYADRSFSIVMSITARMNAAEFRRVLRDDGRLLVALPSAEDLAELRIHAGSSTTTGRDRTARTIETFATGFTLTDQRRVSTTAELSAEAAHDVLVSIYRPLRSRPVEAMRVTFSLDLLLFRAR
jgi:23S rRNA (guanine745-N1)-methyltransferase